MMPIKELVKILQQYQKNYPDINVYVSDSHGDDIEISDVFYSDFNNFDGEAAIIISNE